MPPEPFDRSAPVVVHTTVDSQPIPPRWLPEGTLLLAHARQSGLWAALLAGVRVPRGRAGTYETPDFLLLLMLYALGFERTILLLFEAIRSVRTLLAAMVTRRALPSRFALSRWLGAVSREALEAAREVFLQDQLDNGLRGEHVGGLVDRCGQRHLLFDKDATREVHRQRALVHDAAHPPARRRFDRSCAPGYTGRKRGQTQRSRSVLQQAHTGEWLGTWGHAGNGDVKGELASAIVAATRYLVSRGLTVAQGVFRLDGLYGHLWAAQALSAAGLGYLMRCTDYYVLDDATVARVIEQPPSATYRAAETGDESEVFEVSSLRWREALDVRMIITRRRATPGKKPAIGEQRSSWIYELFVTDRPAPGLTCTDIVSLYHARGGFEGTLAHEDRENDPDRWVSGHPAGQELWQLCAQWVWNARLRLGVAANDPGVRTTIWSEALPRIPPSDARTEMPRGASATLGTIAAAAGRGSGRYGANDFAWTIEGLLRCPAGALLRPGERRIEARGVRVIFAASVQDCFGCERASECRGENATMARGRRVSVWYGEAANDGIGAAAAVLWNDVPARRLRNAWSQALGREAMVLGPAPQIAPPAPPRPTRARRARRRLSWKERYARNALPAGTARWPITLHGVPRGISQLLRDHASFEAVA